MLRLAKVILGIPVVVAMTLTTGMAFSGTAVAATPNTTPAVTSAVTPDAQPEFNFCNETGPNHQSIACFKANIVFNSRNTFTLSNISLKDTCNDSRAVYALVVWNGGYDQRGLVGPENWPFTFENPRGPGTSPPYANRSFSASKGISYVYIILYAANTTGYSTPVTSRQRTNPWY